MTNQELSAAIKDLDQQLEEFMRERVPIQWLYGNLPVKHGTTLCYFCGADFAAMHPAQNVWPHMIGNCVSVSNQDGQAGGVRKSLGAPAPAERGESHSSDSPRTQDSCVGQLGGSGSTGLKQSLLEERGSNPQPIAGMRITFAEPARHAPTKWIGWLIVSLALWGVGVLVWAWVRR